MVCLYSVIGRHMQECKIYRCDRCSDRQVPACVDACPTRTLVYQSVTFDTVTSHPVVTGLWTNAVEMGRCAGANMTGHATVYGGTLGICAATQVAGLPFVSMGIVHTSGTDYETHTQSTSNGYRKLVFTPHGDRLVGALFIGDIANIGLYLTIIRERTKLSAFKNQVLAHRLHYGHLLDSRHITPARLKIED